MPLITFHILFGLFGYTLFFYWLLQKIWRGRLQQRWLSLQTYPQLGSKATHRFAFALSLRHIALVFVSLVLALILAYYARSFFSDLSALSTVLVCLLWRGRSTQRPLWLPGLTVAVGLFLYVSAMGFLMAPDVYGWGYAQSPLAPEVSSSYIGLVAALAGLALVLLWQGLWHPLLALLIALSLFAVGLLPSPNLWDAVLDPWLFFYCCGRLIARLLPQRFCLVSLGMKGWGRGKNA